MKSKKIQFLKSIIYFVIIFILVGTYNNIVAEEIYYPSPIIFVHGVDSDDSTWNSAERELRKYFYNTDGTCKYFDYGYDYLIFAGYADQNNGDIPTIARTALKNEVYYATDRLPDGYKKVNIITHSMGGLVTRSFLKQFSSVYQSNINKVIFIGTPHLGAPSASALWILNKIRNEIIQPALRDYNSFYSQSSGSRFRFADKSGIVMASGLPVGIYNGLTGKLSEELANIDLVLTNADRFGPDPAGTALTQLRLSNNVYYHKTISAGLLWDKKEINIDAMIAGNNTFLGQASQNLAIPNNFKTVRGDISPLRNFFSWILSWGISQTIDLFNNNFTFPQGQSLLDAKNTGDGIVTMASQEGIGSADYIVNAFHTDEPKAWQTILQALDDPPVIESVRLVPVNWNGTYEAINWAGIPYGNQNYYIAVKLKDYLLADIEIESMTLNGENKIPTSFIGQDGKKKPYNLLKKRFLQERYCDSMEENAQHYDIDGTPKNLHLMPGEFFLGPFELRYDLSHIFYIKIKNAADKSVEATVNLQAPRVTNLDVTPHSNFYYSYPFFIDVPPSVPDPYGNDPNNAPNPVSISFKIEDNPSLQARVNIWIDYRKLVTDRVVNLDASGASYSKQFDNFTTWDGKDDNGNYVPNNIIISGFATHCRVKINVQPIAYGIVGTGLVGANWNGINPWDYDNRTIIIADPTFIQPSRRESISW